MIYDCPTAQDWAELSQHPLEAIVKGRDVRRATLERARAMGGTN